MKTSGSPYNFEDEKIETFDTIEEFLEDLKEQTGIRTEDPDNILKKAMRKIALRGGAFGYNWAYLLTHPWKIIEGVYYKLKYAWQRVFRGWDDTAIWSIDYYLSKQLSEMLPVLKEKKPGIPLSMFPADMELGAETEEQVKEAGEKWDAVLDEMTEGFAYHYEYETNILPYSEYDAMKKKLDRSLELLKKYYEALWD